MRFIMRNKDSDRQLRDTTNGKTYHFKILNIGEYDHDGCPVAQKTFCFIDDAGDYVYYSEYSPSGAFEVIE